MKKNKLIIVMIIIQIILLQGCSEKQKINDSTNVSTELNPRIEAIGKIDNKTITIINKEIANLPDVLFKDLKHIYITEQSLSNLTNSRTNIYGKYYPETKKIYLNGNPYQNNALTHELLHHFDITNHISDTKEFNNLINIELKNLKVSDFDTNDKNQEYFVAIGLLYFADENIKKDYPLTYKYLYDKLISLG